MLQAKKRWKVSSVDESKVAMLTEQLKIEPLVAKLLVNRGIETIDAAVQFLHKKKVSYHDPFLLKGMEETVDRIKQAIINKEKILIFGDYDADGVSSTSVMVHTLREQGATFDYYIPNRFTEGYGPNEPALRHAKSEGYSLVVTVDTGISAVYEATIAKEIGLDFIITDHHEPPPVLPDAYSIVNPKQPGCPYPFKGLAGVGVAFKLSHALLGRVPVELLDIAVIGTIADLVPLVDENRLLAKQGIAAFQASRRPGINALKKVCSLEGKTITAEHIGFSIGPRINAAGRLDSADPAVQLLISQDQEEVNYLASELDLLNKNRQDLVNQIANEAIVEVEEKYASDENRVLIVAKENWNPGVIGIVASKLVEKFYRPTIVMNIDKEKGIAKGSARSIEGFDMFESLSESRDILPHFGGHPMAAGLTMKLTDVDQLRERLNLLAAETLSEQDFVPVTSIDLVSKIEELTLEVVDQVEQLAPFGVNNPTPKIMLENVNISQIRRIGADEKHLKVVFEHSSHTIDSVGFGLGHVYEEITPEANVSAIGTLSINEWNGHCKPQLFIEDLAVNEWQLFDYRGKRNISKKFEQLPKEKLLFISFQKDTINKLALQSFEEYFTYVDTNEGVIPNLSGKFVVLVDLPQEISQLEKVVKNNGQPERIYTVFKQDEEHFFTTIPGRDHFKWFYAFLLKKKSFHFQKHADQLAKHKGWSKDTITFMTKVFLELEFVTINDGIICLQDTPTKKDLIHSKTYKRKQEQAKLENELLYSSYQALKERIESLLITEEKKVLN